MRIRKISPQVPLRGNVSNEYGTSEENAYAQEYQNEHNVIVSTDTPTTSERVWFKYSQNLFDGQLELGNYDNSGAKTTATDIYRNVNIVAVKPETTYTFSINGINQKYVLYYYNSSKTFISMTTSLTSGTFTTPANCYYINFRCFGADFTNDYADLNVKLEEGSEIVTSNLNVDNKNFTETISVGEDKNNSRVWFKQEKNIINTKDYIASTTTNGITYSNNGDGTFSLSGTATADTTIVIIPIGKIDLKASQPYYLYSSEPYNNQTFNLSVIYNDNGIKYLVANNTVTPTNTPTSVRLSFYIANGKTVNAKNVRLKLLENSKYITPSINVDNEEICNLQTYSNYSIINGLKLCYGEVSSGSVSANTGKDLSVDLPTTYNDTNYKVIASINTGSSYWAELNLTAHSDTTSKIEISLWNNGANATDCTISYIVIGK